MLSLKNFKKLILVTVVVGLTISYGYGMAPEGNRPLDSSGSQKPEDKKISAPIGILNLPDELLSLIFQGVISQHDLQTPQGIIDAIRSLVKIKKTNKQFNRILSNNEIGILLKHAGADKNIADSMGYTPLHLAAYHRNTKIVDMLLRAGADLTQVDTYEQTALQLAEQTGYTNAVTMIRQRARKMAASRLYTPENVTCGIQ